MNIAISPIFGFQLGIDYIQDVESEEGFICDLVRVSLGIIFIHIVVNVDAE
jgi:hypothetical protein